MRDYLITARKKQNFTHEYIAYKVGISRQYYGMIENSERTPSVIIAKKIGELLEIDWTLFFDDGSNFRLHNNLTASTS